MIAKITHIENIESLTNYQFKKMEEGVSFLLDFSKVDTRSKSHSNFSFKAQTELKNEVAKPYVHITLNFPVSDKNKLDDAKFIELGHELMQDMGYLDQPFMIFKHTDQEHPHIHIITHIIKDNGSKVSEHFERNRIMESCRRMELKHDFTIVSSLKADSIKEVRIENDNDYKAYLKTSVGSALGFKAKRYSDFKAVLSEVYGIESYQTKSKGENRGVSFALTNENKSRYIEGKGTMAIAGSKLSAGYSYNRIGEKINENYKTAPKRYRYSIHFTEKLNNRLFYFDTITKEAFNQLNTDTVLFNVNNTRYILDQKGKNIYRDTDLKDFKGNTIGEAVKVNLDKQDKGHESLKTLIIREAIEEYRKDSSSLKTSFFLQDIFIQEKLIDYLENSKLFQLYNPFLDGEQLQSLFNEVNNIDKDTFIEYFQTKEQSINDTLTEAYQTFLEKNGIESKELFNDAKRKEFSPTLVAQLVVMTEREILKQKDDEASKKKLESMPIYLISSQHYFESLKYFKADDLNSESREAYEKVINKGQLKEVYNQALKTSLTSQELINNLNGRGVEVVNEQANLVAKLPDFEKGIRIDSIKDFIKPKDLQNQRVESNQELIQARIAFDNSNWYQAERLIETLPISEQLELENKEEFKAFKEEKTNVISIESELNSILKEQNMTYRSDLLEMIKMDDGTFSEVFISKDPLKGIPQDFIKDYLSKITTDESIKDTLSKEKEKIEKDIHLVSNFSNKAELLSLMGYRNEGDFITEQTGKHLIDSEFRPNSQIAERFKAEPDLKYHSHLLKDMVKGLVDSKLERHQTPEKLFTFKKVEEFLGKDSKLFEELAVKNYLEYYLDQSKGVPSEEVQEFLNTKGIQVIENTKGEQNIQILSFDYELNVQDPITIQYDQEQAFGHKDYLNEQIFWLQMELQNNLESGNYGYAAYLVKSNGLNVWLSEADSIYHQEALDKAINELPDYNRNAEAYLLLNSFKRLISEGPLQQGESNKKDKDKARKKRKGRGV